MDKLRGRLASLLWIIGAANATVLGGATGCGESTPAAGPGVGGVGGTRGGGGNGGSTAIGGSGGAGAPGTGGVGGQPAGCPLPNVAPGSWAEVSPPAGQDGFRVTDAFAVGTDDLLFAGSVSVAGGTPASARVLRWSHGCWTVELTIPPSGSPPASPSVHGTGANDVWATGGDLLFHRDAQGWTRFVDESWRGLVRQPPSFAGPLELVRVRAATPTAVWIAASSNILRWNGQSWTAFNFDDPNYPNDTATIGFGYRDIWTDGASDVWVAGGSDQVGNTMDFAFVHHFDGANWTHTSIGLGVVESIWRGGAVLWLANPTLDTVNGQVQVLTMRRFDGTSAPAVTMLGVDPNNPVAMVTLWGRGAGDLWAAGDDVAHFDGQSWSLVADAPAPARSDTDEHNTLVTGDAASVWLATPGPRFFRKVTGP